MLHLGTDKSLNSKLGAAASGVAVVVWGFGNVLVRVIPLPGPTISFFRLWLGAALALVVMLSLGRRIDFSAFRASIAGGTAFGLNSILFFTAVKYTSPTTATVIGTLQPAILLVVVGRLFGEKVRGAAVIASAVALGGTVVVVFGAPASGHDSLFGNLLAVASLLSYCVYFVASKKAREHVGTLQYQFAIQVVAALVATPVVFLTRSTLRTTGHDWLLIALLAIVPGGGHYLVNWAHKHTELSLVSILTLLTPIATMALSYPMLGESVTWLQVGGTAVVIVALSFVVFRSSLANGDLAEV